MRRAQEAPEECYVTYDMPEPTLAKVVYSSILHEKHSYGLSRNSNRLCTFICINNVDKVSKFNKKEKLNFQQRNKQEKQF